MENEKTIECSIMEEVHEMRRKVSAEFGHDLNRLVAYYQELENEMRKSGKYKFAALPNEKLKEEENIFDTLVSVWQEPEKLESINAQTRSLEYLLAT